MNIWKISGLVSLAPTLLPLGLNQSSGAINFVAHRLGKVVIGKLVLSDHRRILVMETLMGEGNSVKVSSYF